MTALPSLPALAQSAVQVDEYRTEFLHLAERSGATLLRVHSLRDPPGEEAAFTGWPVRTGNCLDGDPAVLCLRPREWLLLGEGTDPDGLLDRVLSAADPSTTAVYAQPDGLGVFRLSGTAAPWLLAKLSGLDFLAGIAGGPHCARTRMGHVAVVVHYRGEHDGAFDLVVDRSLARYLWELLIDSAPHAEELTRTGWARRGGDNA
jgi:heterotetrameric sarcosine oxidase gamma subunit